MAQVKILSWQPVVFLRIFSTLNMNAHCPHNNKRNVILHTSILFKALKGQPNMLNIKYGLLEISIDFWHRNFLIYPKHYCGKTYCRKLLGDTVCNDSSTFVLVLSHLASIPENLRDKTHKCIHSKKLFFRIDQDFLLDKYIWHLK